MPDVQGNVFVCFDPAKFEEQVKKCGFRKVKKDVVGGIRVSSRSLERSGRTTDSPTSTPAIILARSLASNAQCLCLQLTTLSYLRVDIEAKLLAKEYPTVTFKPLRKPFKTYTKSFAHLGDALTEKHVNAFMKQSIASHRSEGGEL